MKELNSKQETHGNKDSWWYNICSPKNLTSKDIIILNLWNTMNKKLVKQVTLNLGKSNWLKRILKGSTHYSKGTEICKVHIQRDHRTNQFIIYFGHKEDGVYLI